MQSKEMTIKSEVSADICKNRCNSLDLMPQGPNIPVIVIFLFLSFSVFSFVSLLLYTHNNNNNSVNAFVLQMHTYNCAHF